MFNHVFVQLSQQISQYAFVVRFYHLHYSLYNGQRDSLSILTWKTAFFPKKIRDLSFSDFQQLDKKHTRIIYFYLPNCQPCQKLGPEFAIAAQVNAI